jgi:hypothetical protein
MLNQSISEEATNVHVPKRRTMTHQRTHSQLIDAADCYKEADETILRIIHARPDLEHHLKSIVEQARQLQQSIKQLAGHQHTVAHSESNALFDFQFKVVTPLASKLEVWEG